MLSGFIMIQKGDILLHKLYRKYIKYYICCTNQNTPKHMYNRINTAKT